MAARDTEVASANRTVITLKEGKVKPKKLIVPVGTTIEWRIQSSRKPTSKLNPALTCEEVDCLGRQQNVFTQDNIEARRKFSYQFYKPGNYTFTYEGDKQSKGSIVIQDRASQGHCQGICPMCMTPRKQSEARSTKSFNESEKSCNTASSLKSVSTNQQESSGREIQTPLEQNQNFTEPEPRHRELRVSMPEITTNQPTPTASESTPQTDPSYSELHIPSPEEPSVSQETINLPEISDSLQTNTLIQEWCYANCGPSEVTEINFKIQLTIQRLLQFQNGEKNSWKHEKLYNRKIKKLQKELAQLKLQKERVLQPQVTSEFNIEDFVETTKQKKRRSKKQRKNCPPSQQKVSAGFDLWAMLGAVEGDHNGHNFHYAEKLMNQRWQKFASVEAYEYKPRV